MYRNIGCMRSIDGRLRKVSFFIGFKPMCFKLHMTSYIRNAVNDK